MPLSQVAPGMQCSADTVIQGTTISTFDVQVLSVVEAQYGEGPYILVTVSGAAVAGTGVAEGFSGSPVYCPGALGTPELIGAISEGIGQYGNTEVLVTPIQQMLGEPVHPPSALPRFTARTHPLLGPLTVGGLSPALLDLVERAGKLAGREVAAAPSASAPDYPVQPLVPGASVAVAYSEGAIPVGAVGTVTYRDGNDIYAFGHELDGAGARSLLLQDAYVYGVVGDPDPSLGGSFKLAVPGHTEGTVTSDTSNAVIGTVGAGPRLIPVDVTARDRDTGHVLHLDSEVADETAVGDPLGASLADTIAPLAAAQAATEVYNGPPANESGSMCLSVFLRGSQQPLRFCNRYVGTGSAGDMGEGPPELATATMNDATNALGLLDAETFAQLHVTKIRATIQARRGLLEAQILSASAPRRVRPGEAVRVHLHVRLYRGPLRTITLPLRIPRGVHGTFVARLAGPSPSGSESQVLGSLASSLAEALGGGSAVDSGFGPSSLLELRALFAATAAYDGLTLSIKGQPAVKAFRDPSLLVLGDAVLPFTAPPARKPGTPAPASATGGSR
jgi:hypothetical protein